MSGELHVQNLGKSYRQWGGELRRIASWFVSFIHPREEHWVLKGVSFSISPGEAVGIVGQNGAGKSTLLKLITGTTSPTQGHVQLRGRVAAILELGMGFNPDLTGRQNAYHSAGLMGYSQADIDRVMPEIEAFAEVGEYFDQPVRTYSSGMQMRVAFSVATARRPDVLIVDEALSVGDAYFQHKSFDRIREFRKQGTTLLIVSHDKGAIQSICDRAILINAGCLVMQGEPEAVMDYYNAMLAEKENQTVRQQETSDGKLQTISGSGEATIADIALLNEKGERIEAVNVGQPVQLRIVVQIKADLPELVLGYMIKDRLGQPVFGTNTHHLDQALIHVPRDTTVTFCFNFNANLGCGTYSVAVALHTADTHIANNYEWRDLALVFTVVSIDKATFVGMSWLPPTLTITQ
ncbi:MAG: ABC transporter ATP-binding protein [Methylobacter sp.]